MPNKVIIKNKLPPESELAKKLEEESRKNLLWGIQPDRKKKQQTDIDKEKQKDE